MNGYLKKGFDYVQAFLMEQTAATLVVTQAESTHTHKLAIQAYGLIPVLQLL